MKTSIIVFSTTKEKAEHKLNQLFEGKEDRIIERSKDTVETYCEYYRAIGINQE